jgi:hypothetical protein
MNCKELITIFEKIGGKFKCDYNSNKCTIYPQNINCQIDHNSYINLDMLLMKFAKESYKYKSYLPSENNNNIEILQNYQQVPISGFIIKFNRDN